MPLYLPCPACQKQHALPEGFSARKVRCDCGTVIDVAEAQARAVAGEPLETAPPEPSPAEEERWANLERDDEGDIYALAEPPPRPSPTASPPPPPPPPPPESPPWRRERPLDAVDLATLRGEGEVPPWKARLRDRLFQRTAVGMACLIYAPLMIVLTLVGAAWGGLGLSTVFNIAAASGMFVGGRMILRGDARGPAWAGLSATILCFFAVSGLVIKIAAALLSFSLLLLMRFVAELVVLYSAPVVIVAWCLREESDRQRKAEDFQDFD